MTPRSAYIHVPFCRHRCGYCNFTVVERREDLIEAYLEAVERELRWVGGPHQLDTLFFGGGTPTHLAPRQLERLFEAVRKTFPLAPGYEWTVEANPTDVEPEKVELLARWGVTRISLGAQSFDAGKLNLLERDHRAAGIHQAVERVRKAALSVSLDLIFAAPNETLLSWQSDLQQALALKPDHLSTYGLTFERGTSFFSRLHRGRLTPVDEELERAMYETAIDKLTEAGFEHYEVSSFAQPGRRCRHNETYWSGQSYFGVGPGAARYVEGCRETNHRSTTTYLRRVLSGQSPVAEREQLGSQERAREQLVLGLRRLEGVDRTTFAHDTGYDLDALAGKSLQRFVRLGLLEDTGSCVKLTRQGLLVSDGLWPDLI